MAKNKADLKIPEIIRELERREGANDGILSQSRGIIRRCANSIKMMHAREMASAKKEVAQMKKELASLPKTDAHSEYLLEPIWQEAVEAQLLLAAIERKPLPSYRQLSVPFEAYLLGVCDVVGEFRREMLECLKRGNRRDAEYFFELMSSIYEELLPIRFSNSVLPNFRKKQDVARMQVEQARSELLRAGK